MFLLGLIVGVGGLVSWGHLWAAQPAASSGSDSRPLGKFEVLSRAIALLEQNYVRPLDREKLVASAIEGMTRKLDPHTSYLPARAAKMLNEEIDGAFGGVGMVVTWDQQWLDEHGRALEGEARKSLAKRISRRISLRVESVVPDSPAQKAGLIPGDRIVEIEGQSVSQFSGVGAAVMKMRGPIGTPVRFRYRRKGVSFEVCVDRALVKTPPLLVKKLGDQITHLELGGFQRGSADTLRETIRALRKEGAIERGVILDLRDNGGGLLDEAVEVADLFISKGSLLRTRGRGTKVLERWRAHGPGTFNKVKVVVLINKGSASASEIVAGALQDYRRALIVGERSFGKGSVQVPFELGDGSLLKTTVALYYTPHDRLIQATGIEPDLWVGAGAPGFEDSRAGLQSERDVALHLRPEDFGRKSPPVSAAESKSTARLPAPKTSMIAAGEDAQLRAAVDYLWAADLL